MGAEAGFLAAVKPNGKGAFSLSQQSQSEKVGFQVEAPVAFQVPKIRLRERHLVEDLREKTGRKIVTKSGAKRSPPGPKNENEGSNHIYFFSGFKWSQRQEH